MIETCIFQPCKGNISGEGLQVAGVFLIKFYIVSFNLRGGRDVVSVRRVYERPHGSPLFPRDGY